MDSLANLRETIREHGREHLPVMLQELESSEQLDAAIEDAARKTEEAVVQLVAQGTHLWNAWIEVREQWAILPAEETADPVEHLDGWEWLWENGEK